MFSWLEWKEYLWLNSVDWLCYIVYHCACGVAFILDSPAWSIIILQVVIPLLFGFIIVLFFWHQLNLVGWFNAVFGIIFCIQTTCIIELGSCRRISSFVWFYAMLMWSGTHSNFYSIYFSLCFPVIYLEIYINYTCSAIYTEDVTFVCCFLVDCRKM